MLDTQPPISFARIVPQQIELQWRETPALVAMGDDEYLGFQPTLPIVLDHDCDMARCKFDQGSDRINTDGLHELLDQRPEPFGIGTGK